MNANLPIFKVVFTEDSEMLVNSLVEQPAHGVDFILLEKHKTFTFDAKNNEVLGVVIAANHPIYYYSKDIPECYLLFDKETIKQIALNYFKNERFNLIDINHDYNIKENDAVMIETYFAGKENPFGVNEGSWIARYKILNSELLSLIQEGKLKGFSIYGKFGLEKMTFNHKKNKTMELIEKIKKLIMSETQAELKFELVQTIDGKQLKAYEELKEGNKITLIATDGTEVTPEDGEYIIQKDGKLYVVNISNGFIASIVEKQDDTQIGFSKVAEDVVRLSNDITELKQAVALLTEVLEKRLKFNAPPAEAPKKPEFKAKVY